MALPLDTRLPVCEAIGDMRKKEGQIMECGGWDGQSDGQVVAHSKPEADSEAGAEALSSRSENIE